MTNRTTTIELNVQTLVALTGINRTSIVSICKRAEELGLKFEKDSRDKIIYTEQDFELLKKVKKMKDKYKYTYEQALQKLFEDGELNDHLTTEQEKKQTVIAPIPEKPMMSLVKPNPEKKEKQMQINVYPPLTAPTEEEKQRILEQIQYLENFLNFVRNDVQSQLKHLYNSIDVKFTETSKELSDMKDKLSNTN